jgi:bile acid-coenzyme A ligase
VSDTRLGDIPRTFADEKPDALAVDYPDRTLTWSDLERAANRRARLLADAGVRAGDLVAITLGNSALFHETVFAIWKLGATPAPLSPRLPEPELAALLALIEPRLVVGPAPVSQRYRVLPADADASGYAEASVSTPLHAPWKAMASGGSTGRPKLILDLTAPSADRATLPLQTKLCMRPGATVLNPGPLHHNGPFLFSNLALFAGGAVVGTTWFDAAETLRLLAERRVNWVMLVPTMMHRIWNLPSTLRDRADLSSLEAVWHMAAPCPAWLKMAWMEWLGPERIWELYGGTEGIGTTVIRGDAWLERPGSVGQALEGSHMAILDDAGRECPPGAVGEVCFDVPAAPYRYLGAEPRRRGSSWQSLGDVGHVDADGFLYLADRRDDLILRGGANIYPAEIEAVLDRHPQVASSAVVGVPCPELGQRVHAIVEAPETLSLESLHTFCATYLAKYKLPESYELTRAPLRDDAGKVRRSRLRAERAAWLEAGRPFQRRIP